MRGRIAAVILTSLSLAATAPGQNNAPPSQIEQQTAKLVAEYHDVQMPAYDRARANEAGYLDEYRKAMAKALDEKVRIGGELLKLHASPDALAEVMPERWQIMLYRTGDRSVLSETESLVKSSNENLRNEALFMHAAAMQRFGQGSFDDQLAATEAFHSAAPKDARYVRLISALAENTKLTNDRRVALYRQAIAEFPNDRGTKYLSGKVRQIENIGQPFALSFTDATSGRELSLDAMRGKVVVVDFWATWCGPCVAEMPHMKELYSEFHDKGMEIVGVSLDQPEAQGGLEKLRSYCKDNEIPWPQYYQGNGWESEFSTSWGINAIPCMFVVDKQGNLVTVEGRGQLEKLVPELLAKPSPEG